MIPHHCTAYLDIRSAPNDNQTIAKIKKLIPPDVSITIDSVRINHFVEQTNPNVLLLKNLTKEIRGKDLPFRLAHGTSDAPYYTKVGCDAIEFGPLGNGAHQDNEYVDIQGLEDYYHVLKSFLLKIDVLHQKQSTQHQLQSIPAFFEDNLRV